MKIKEIHEVTPRLVEAFKKLLPQLSSSVNIRTNDDWEKILKSPEITVLPETNIEGSALELIEKFPFPLFI